MGGFDWLGLGGNLLGNLGDSLDVASAFATNDKTSDGLGLGAGLASSLSAGAGLIGAGSDIASGKKGAGWDLFDGLMGLGGGISGMISSGAGLAGDDTTKNRSQIASGAFGLLGGGANVIHGIMDMAKDGFKADSLMNILGGGAKLFGGITSIGQGVRPKNKGWETAGKVSAITSLLAGLAGTGVDAFTGDDAAAPPATP